MNKKETAVQSLFLSVKLELVGEVVLHIPTSFTLVAPERLFPC